MFREEEINLSADSSYIDHNLNNHSSGEENHPPHYNDIDNIKPELATNLPVCLMSPKKSSMLSDSLEEKDKNLSMDSQDQKDLDA